MVVSRERVKQLRVCLVFSEKPPSYYFNVSRYGARMSNSQEYGREKSRECIAITGGILFF